MELLLTQADFDAMPAELREQLLLHLAGRFGAREDEGAEGVALDREQVTALIREVSFHHAGGQIRVLLQQLVDGETGKSPTRTRIIDAMQEDAAHFGRHLAALDRMVAKVSGRRHARLCRHDRKVDTYTMKPRTRTLIRELLATIKASGKDEEPMWE